MCGERSERYGSGVWGLGVKRIILAFRGSCVDQFAIDTQNVAYPKRNQTWSWKVNWYKREMDVKRQKKSTQKREKNLMEKK